MNEIAKNVLDAGTAYLAAKKAAEADGYRVSIQSSSDGEIVVVDGGPEPVVVSDAAVGEVVVNKPPFTPTLRTPVIKDPAVQ